MNKQRPFAFSYAIASQRIEPPDSLDLFQTRPWAARALIDHWIGANAFAGASVWEPAAGEGYLARGLTGARSLIQTDIHSYGPHLDGIGDFLQSEPYDGVDLIISNPPFNLAAEFVLRCLELRPSLGFAMLMRMNWLEGQDRYRTIFHENRPDLHLVFSERLPVNAGRPKADDATATAYSWFCWSAPFDNSPTITDWIPPGSRDRLQRSGDYLAPWWDNNA